MKRILTGHHHICLDIYPACKYECFEDPDVVEFDNVEAFEVLTHEAAAELNQEFIESGIGADPYGEYLIVYMQDGSTATYRNSLVDLFHI